MGLVVVFHLQVVFPILGHFGIRINSVSPHKLLHKTIEEERKTSPKPRRPLTFGLPPSAKVVGIFDISPAKVRRDTF
jgi:hypothetical protein